MKLVRLTPIKAPPPEVIRGPEGPPGPRGVPGPPGPTVVVEVPAQTQMVLPPEVLAVPGELKKLGDQVEILKKEVKKKAVVHSYVGGGGGGVSEVVRYTPQTDAVHQYTASDFIDGFNIIGVRYVGAAEVQLPATLPSTRIVSIKDEAGLGQITVNSY